MTLAHDTTPPAAEPRQQGLQHVSVPLAKAIEELVEAAGTKTQAELLEIRARVWQARKFQEWLGRAVENGLQALEMLKEEE